MKNKIILNKYLITDDSPAFIRNNYDLIPNIIVRFINYF